MGRLPKRPFRIACAYDTETTNIEIDGEWKAFPVCYQVNDLRDIDIARYVPDECDNIEIYRREEQMQAFIDDCVQWGEDMECVPVLCGYNLLFDLQPLIANLSARYGMEVSAQSSTNVYAIDLMRDGKRVMRMWDTYHLEMRGLAAMGETAGLAKLDGDWDYTLIRTPETPLTPEEIGYASRDVQVIPAYLRYLLDSNDWLTPDMLGCKVLTKTSLVRQMAQHEIAHLKAPSRRGQDVFSLFVQGCVEDMPGCYYDYGLRKACFLGGFTFTAARYASQVVRNVCSLDVTSMHHTFINGRYAPEQFRPVRPHLLRRMCDTVLSTSLEAVLARYHKPFPCAFHAKLRFRNIRLRHGSCFDEWGIALSPRGKFGLGVAGSAEYSKSEAAQWAEKAAKLAGWRNGAKGARFAFGKLYYAEEVEMHVHELELWSMSRVYEWDSYEVIFGEGTCKFQRPPDYVTLQSNLLFERKQDMKRIVSSYRDHTPYTGEIPASVPDGIVQGLREGRLSHAFVDSYYSNTVKGMFNGIYGTQAQDVFKADYLFDEAECDIAVDRSTVLTPENFRERLPEKPKVRYTYGMRIVGGSRMHMVIAMELLHRALGGHVRVTGGDTDSMKVSCDDDVTDEMLEDALLPIADASKRAIDICMERVRRCYPQYASELTGIGAFEVEGAGDGTRWAWHMDAWNKARVSCTEDGRSHITCAGLSRPDGLYHIENFIDDCLKERPAAEVFPDVLGYNVYMRANLTHALQRTNPPFTEMFKNTVFDYLGRESHAETHASIALYPIGRAFGETDMPANAENVAYVRERYGRAIDTTDRILDVIYDASGLPHPYIDREE